MVKTLAEDKRGIDGYLRGQTVQIKCDKQIVFSDNLYHEMYEKTVGRGEQDWRPSPHQARLYAFITVDRAWLVPLAILSDLEVGLKLLQIKPTSRGFLIACDAVRGRGFKPVFHNVWGAS